MALSKGDKKWISEMFVDNNRHIGYMVDDKFEDLKEGIGGKLQEFKSDIMDHISSFAKEISDKLDRSVSKRFMGTL